MRFLLVLLLASPAAAVEVVFAPSKEVPEKLEWAIDSAEKTVDVAIYSFTDTRLQKKLKEAAKRGVTVRLILHNARKQARLSDAIEEAGGDVKYVTKVMHHKFMIADSLLLTGSANWSRSAYSRYDEDLLSFDEQKVIDSFQAEFEHIWGNAKEYGEERFPVQPKPECDADVLFTSANLEVTTYRGSPTFRSVAELPGACGSRIIEAIRSAKEEIRIASAHFRRFDFHNELLLAMERGVKVRLLLDQQEFHYPGTKTPNALYDEALAKAGADVRYKVYSRFWDYRTAMQLHAKFLIIDDREVLTGSLNWSENAELNTFENLVAIDKPETAERYVTRFEEMWRYGEGELKELIAKVKESGGREPCRFSPISLTGEDLSRLRSTYANGSCE